MVCDAVATATTQVEQRHLLELFASKEGRKALLHWLYSEFQEVEIFSQSPYSGLTVRFKDEGRLYQVNLMLMGQEVTVWGSRGESQQAVDAIRDKVSVFIRDLGSALLQQRIARAIKRRYPVIESTTAPNKALVLKVRV